MRETVNPRMIRASLLVAVLACWCLAPAAFATTISVSTPIGVTDTAGEVVDASAMITTGTGTVTIKLSNLLTASQVESVGQNLTALSFTLGGITSVGTVNSSTGTFIDVGSGGVVASASSMLSGPNLIGWGLSNSGDVYLLNGLGGSATPQNTIIGGTVGSTTPYSSAKGSIDANGPHNPFVQATGMWTLSISGVTTGTSISDVVFSFGTTSGDNIAAPEPGSALLLLIGLGALLTAAAFRRKKAPASAIAPLRS
jgi:hypothetical protein